MVVEGVFTTVVEARKSVEVRLSHVPAQLPVFVVIPVLPKVMAPEEDEMLIPVVVAKVKGVVQVKPAAAMVAEAFSVEEVT
jgi:hypothetical protein